MVGSGIFYILVYFECTLNVLNIYLVRSSFLTPQAAAQAQAEPKPCWAWAQSSGFKIVEPRLSKAEPKLGLSGRARPAHH